MKISKNFEKYLLVTMDHVSSLMNSLLALYTLVCILCRDKVSMFSGPKIAVQYIALLLYSMWLLYLDTNAAMQGILPTLSLKSLLLVRTR